MTAYKPRQAKTQGLRRGPEESCASKPEGQRDDRLQPRLQSSVPPTRDPGRTRRPRGPILGGPTHQELEHDVGGEGEKGVKVASAAAQRRDSSPARGRNPPPGSGLRPAPPRPLHSRKRLAGPQRPLTAISGSKRVRCVRLEPKSR